MVVSYSVCHVVGECERVCGVSVYDTKKLEKSPFLPSRAAGAGKGRGRGLIVVPLARPNAAGVVPSCSIDIASTRL